MQSHGKEEKTLSTWAIAWVVNSICLLLASVIFPGVVIEKFYIAFIAGFAVSIAVYIIEPVLFLLTLPITVVTFGLFSLVINGITLILVSKLVAGFHFKGLFMGLGWAILTSLLISAVRTVLRVVFVRLRLIREG